MQHTKKLPLIEDDPWIEPYEKEIQKRLDRYGHTLQKIEDQAGSLIDFSNAYTYYGINYSKEKNGWFYREWAPGADQLFLSGNFNDWNRESHPLTINDYGDWEIFLPFEEYQKKLVHESLIKVYIVKNSVGRDRIPAYIRRVVQDPVTYDFCGQIWWGTEFNWDEKLNLFQNQTPLIYEAHVGMAQEKEGIGTYLEFANDILPRIKEKGYNTIQLMAVMEHPYYGSFGYHVSNFFAPSSRFGTPEDLKYLINEAHKLGLAVVMDIVHSHSVKNISEGLNNFDGTDNQYFYSGDRGNHPGWDSKLFNYGKKEVKQFLLSNIKYWLEEFHFDGFRFDGVTSMLYHHHGYTSFDHYDKYFKNEVDEDCITYLQLANELIKTINPHALSIAEDVSGMPGLCRKVEEGGIGFDYRLGMGIPDYWIKILKERSDEEWDIYELWDVLNNRRYKEKTIAYAESHDQAMVGDKTIAFWLMDSSMYFHMMKEDTNIIVERGIALHKMIRLITLSLGGEAYLNFMGNEFGHPEWIDFPRQGNNWNYKHARRQWSLVDSPRLKYQYLAEFDKAMIEIAKSRNILNASFAKQLNMDAENGVIIFERNNLVFVFNLNVSKSIFGYKFNVGLAGKYKIILNSDDKEFGGFGRIDNSIPFFTDLEATISIYLTNRTCLVLEKID